MKNKPLSSQQPNSIISGLAHLLANTYVLYLKTQNFHWNVTGSNFPALHKMFEEQYEALAEAVDVLAERMRALGVKAPASFAEFLKLTTLKEAAGKYTAKQMLTELCRDHTAIAMQLVKLFEAAEQTGDEVTLDLFIQRKTEHDKTAWMLRSSIE